jgi:hypothetical protein
LSNDNNTERERKVLESYSQGKTTPKIAKEQRLSLRDISLILSVMTEFSALVLERRKPFLGKRIDIASDEVTGEQAARILSNELGCKIRYIPVPLEQVYQANEDMARMYDWCGKVGTGIDISALHQEYPEVGWLTFKDWAKYNKLGRPFQ